VTPPSGDNRRRLIKFCFNQLKATGVRITMKETYGAENAKLFEIRCYESQVVSVPFVYSVVNPFAV